MMNWYGPNWPRSSKELFLAMKVSGLLLALRVMVRFVRLDLLLRWLYSETANTKPDMTVMPKTASYIEGVLRRFPANPKGNCFPRALSLLYFATRNGLPVMFHCGVYKSEGNLVGHAWLTLDGKPFLENGEAYQNHTITYSFPPTDQTKSCPESPSLEMSQR